MPMLALGCPWWGKGKKQGVYASMADSTWITQDYKNVRVRPQMHRNVPQTDRPKPERNSDNSL
jgi:hypothetical protein